MMDIIFLFQSKVAWVAEIRRLKSSEFKFVFAVNNSSKEFKGRSRIRSDVSKKVTYISIELY